MRPCYQLSPWGTLRRVIFIYVGMERVIRDWWRHEGHTQLELLWTKEESFSPYPYPLVPLGGEGGKQKDIYNPGNNVNGCIVWHSFVCCAKSLQCVQLFATPWIVAHQAPLPMGFSRQEYLSGFPFPPPGDLPDPEIKPWSLLSPLLAGGFFTTSTNSVVGKKKNFYLRYVSRI